MSEQALKLLKVVSSRVRMFEGDIIRIDDGRLSYPKLFKPEGFKRQDGSMGNPQYSAEFIWEDDQYAEDIRAVQAIIGRFSKIHFKGKDKNGAEVPLLLPLEKTCFRSGTGSGKPEREGCHIFKASEKLKPRLQGKNGVEVEESDGILYAGCRISMLVRLWPLNATGKESKNDEARKAGRKISANLLGVRFMRDDEPFSQVQRPAMNEAFADLDAEDGSVIDDLNDIPF